MFGGVEHPVKTVIAAIVIAVFAEFAIYRSASREYSETLCNIMFIAAAVGAVLVGAFAPRRLLAFCASTALAAPGISYSMIGHGFLEMGGIFHAMAMGGLGVVSYAMFHSQRVRERRDTHQVAPTTDTKP